ncbi:hypothetical protein NQ152_02045 [Microbacterium sp. zg.B48]|uniref:hypothetical protein n=1 Tax=Microbacterium sp. zg.B48 TaxID=2969408 RepID=UPI00214D0D6F|nr:hypothetical protein [Microbacterium sp. zg.B48]MCR2762284.1 hypothetical protein [Microbacterium sp. zg.B48]
MDGLTRLAIGGMATVAASVAVVCLVAISTTVALADSAGAPIGARPVIVPLPAAVPTPAPSASTAAPVVTLPAEPETVPAPDPQEVAAPVIPQTPAGEPSAQLEAELAAAVAASGSWDAVRAWAEQRGWTPARTEAWIAQLTIRIENERGTAPDRHDRPEPRVGTRPDPQIPARSGNPSGDDLSGSMSGLKREQSRVPPG